MIILIEKYYPEIILKINKYRKLEFKTLKSNLLTLEKIFFEKSNKCILHIDLYELESYSLYYLIKTMTYLNSVNIRYINKINIYINKKSSIKTMTSFIPNINFIDIKTLDKKLNWINFPKFI